MSGKNHLDAKPSPKIVVEIRKKSVIRISIIVPYTRLN